jgi:hypothetical protein
MKKVYLLIGSIFLMTSCGTMGLVSIPTGYKGGQNEVTAQASNMNFFTLTAMDTHKQSKLLLTELEQKCTNGVTNIRATTSTKQIFFIGMEKLQISGNCK